MDASTIRVAAEDLREDQEAEVQVRSREDLNDLLEILYRMGHAVDPERLEPGRYRLVPRKERVAPHG